MIAEVTKKLRDLWIERARGPFLLRARATRL
jgi:hypothetical protein